MLAVKIGDVNTDIDIPPLFKLGYSRIIPNYSITAYNLVLVGENFRYYWFSAGWQYTQKLPF